MHPQITPITQIQTLGVVSKTGEQENRRTGEQEIRRSGELSSRDHVS